MQKVLPHYIWKLEGMLHPIPRYCELPSWRKMFKRAWKKCKCTPITDPDNLTYVPDVSRWVCTCRAFAKSQFLLCKHLIQLVKPPPPVFFLEVRRAHTTPFWPHPSLQLAFEPDNSAPSLVDRTPDPLVLGSHDFDNCRSLDRTLGQSFVRL
jgi:hypothetical protein